MKGITVKLSDEALRRLREEAKAADRSVASIVRERVELHTYGVARSVHDLSSDLAGSLRGSARSATNARRKFRKR